MTDDPILIRLAEDAAKTAARLQAYLSGEQPDDELITLRDAEIEFRRSNDTVRRWAKEGFGFERDGKLYLRRSMLRTSRRI